MHKIQKKLYKAYGKVAKKLGVEYEVFRPSGILNNITTANYLATEYVSVSRDTQFSSSPSANGATVWTCWIDGRLSDHNDLFDLKFGDYLQQTDKSRTFFIAFQELNLPLMAIECNDTIDIERSDATQISTSGRFEPTVVGNDVPCFVSQTASDDSSSYFPGSTYQSDPTEVWTILLPDPLSEIRLNDKVTNSAGEVGQVLRITRGELGATLEVGKV